jgi:hypothetical protein
MVSSNNITHSAHVRTVSKSLLPVWKVSSLFSAQNYSIQNSVTNLKIQPSKWRAPPTTDRLLLFPAARLSVLGKNYTGCSFFFCCLLSPTISVATDFSLNFVVAICAGNYGTNLVFILIVLV